MAEALKKLGTKPNKDSKVAYQYYAPHNRMYTKPIGRGATWSGMHKPYNMFIQGKSTGHRSNGKLLIYMEGVDCCGGDGKIEHGVGSYERALELVKQWNNTDAAVFLHEPS